MRLLLGMGVFQSILREVIGANEEGILAGRARRAEVSDRVSNNEIPQNRQKDAIKKFKQVFELYGGNNYAKT